MWQLELKILAIACLVQLLALSDSTNGFVYMRNATKRTVGSVIPRPKDINFINGADYASIIPSSLKVLLSDDIKYCPVVTLAVDRYTGNLFFDDLKPEDKDLAITDRKRLGRVEVLNIGKDPSQADDVPFQCDTIPNAEMDESYKLSVTKDTAKDGVYVADLTAKGCWGILRGLETFSQLIFNVSPGVYGVQPVFVDDEPRFKHRGFMLDTARHYISVDNIIKLLDAMSYNKLNVFHWHMVDDQSFPLQSKTYPQLAEKTAFRPSMVYSQTDVKHVVQFASMRGIRVMAELDTPGHSYALRYIDGLLSECYDSGVKNGDFGPIDPTKEESLTIVSKLVREFGSLIPDRFFHAGGDEVDFDCWKSSPEIAKWMASHNITEYEGLSNLYLRKLYKVIREAGKQMVVWQEVFDNGAELPKDTIIHVWKDINDEPKYLAELKRVVSSGYHALLSSCWYLNYIDYGQDWIKYYKCDPTRGLQVSNKLKYQVLGGEICMWTEWVDDTNVVSRTWPRASAAAERLWSPESANDTEEFLNRLEQMRCRFRYRNINAEPVNGPGYC